MPPAPAPGRHRAERGHVFGALIFGLVLAGVMIGGYLWLESRALPPEGTPAGSGSNGGAADRWTRLLGTFLAKGPEGGTWETRYLSCTYKHVLAPHPREPDTYLIAQLEPKGADRPRAVSRWLVPRQFFRSPPSLFFSNYTRTQGPERETLPDGTRTWRVHWGRRADPDSMTERRVWFSAESGEVVQIADYSRAAHLIRRVRRLSTGTGDWNPAGVDPERLQRFERAPPDPGADPERALSGVAAKAPFPIYTPTYVPPGFVLVRASYTRFSAEDDEGEERDVQLVSQLYSDGLALISVAVAPRRDMDVIERMNAMEDNDDPSACPGLPEDAVNLRHEGSVVRMRSDACRTVLRRDDLGAVSVTLIGRNELAADEYLRMVATLEAVPGEPDSEGAR